MRTLILLFFALSSAATAAPPNVVLFLIDDLGWKDLGCQGSDYYQTPNIDRLAADGIRFTDAYAACAVCSPTRASVLTGKYPARVMLTPLLKGGDYLDRLSLYWHYPHYNRHPHSAPASIMRRAEWKLIEFLESGKVELYNLAKDIGESNNLAAEEVGRVTKMRAELDVWRREVGAEPMLPNPEYQGKP